MITLSRAVERFPDAPQVYAAIGHVWLAEAQRHGDRVALNKAIEALSHAAGRGGKTKVVGIVLMLMQLATAAALVASLFE